MLGNSPLFTYVSLYYKSHNAQQNFAFTYIQQAQRTRTRSMTSVIVPKQCQYHKCAKYDNSTPASVQRAGQGVFCFFLFFSFSWGVHLVQLKHPQHVLSLEHCWTLLDQLDIPDQRLTFLFHFWALPALLSCSFTLAAIYLSQLEYLTSGKKVMNPINELISLLFSFFCLLG